MGVFEVIGPSENVYQCSIALFFAEERSARALVHNMINEIIISTFTDAIVPEWGSKAPAPADWVEQTLESGQAEAFMKVDGKLVRLTTVETEDMFLVTLRVEKTF